MPIEFVSGDLFANRFKAQALAHACNCQGSMGAGYGGLSWKKVRAIIERMFADWPGRLYVYEEFAPEAKEAEAAEEE